MAAQFLPSQELLPTGYFTMGAGLLCLSHESSVEQERALVLAHGSDFAPQPITLHRCLGAFLVESVPGWFSNDYDYHAGLAVAQLTDSGFEDVIVAVVAGKDQRFEGGGVKVYRGTARGLDPNPVWLARGFSAWSITVGDFSASGRLDIAVSSLWEAGTLSHSAALGSGRTRLLLQQPPASSAPGALPRFSEQLLAAEGTRGLGALAAADMDLDGTLDLVCGGSRVSVLYGPLGSGQGGVGQRFEAAESSPFTYDVAVSRHPALGDRQLIASSCSLLIPDPARMGKEPEASHGVLIHVPQRGAVLGAAQRITLPPGELPAALAIAHLEGELPTLLVGAMHHTIDLPLGAPLRLFTGERQGRLFAAVSSELPGQRLMAAHVLAGELLPRSTAPAEVEEHFVVPAGPPRAVFTLSQHPITRIVAVEARLPPAGQRRYAPSALGQDGPHFVTTPASNWISLVPPLPAGAELVVRHLTARPLDVVATSSSPLPPAGASALWHSVR